MRRSWISLTLGALLVVAGAAAARADEMGCCEAECRTNAAPGQTMVTKTRSEMTQSQCQERFFGCVIAWHPEACPGVAGETGVARQPEADPQ